MVEYARNLLIYHGLRITYIFSGSIYVLKTWWIIHEIYWEGYLTIMQLLLQAGFVLAPLTRTWIICFECFFLAWKNRVHFTESVIVQNCYCLQRYTKYGWCIGWYISLFLKNRFLCCVHTLLIFIIYKTDIVHAKMENEPLTKRQTAKNTKHWKAFSIGRWPFLQWPLLCLPEQQIISEISNKMYK